MVQAVLKVRYLVLLATIAPLFICLAHEWPELMQPTSRALVSPSNGTRNGAVESELPIPLTRQILGAPQDVLKFVVHVPDSSAQFNEGKILWLPQIEKLRGRKRALVNIAQFVKVYKNPIHESIGDDAPPIFLQAATLRKMEVEMLTAVEADVLEPARVLLSRYEQERKASGFRDICDEKARRQVSAYCQWKNLSQQHSIEHLRGILHGWLALLGSTVEDPTVVAGAFPALKSVDDENVKVALKQLNLFVEDYNDVETYGVPARDLLGKWKQGVALAMSFSATTKEFGTAPKQIRNLAEILELTSPHPRAPYQNASRAAAFLCKKSLPERKDPGELVKIGNSQGSIVVKRSDVFIKWKDKTKGKGGYSPLHPSHDEYTVQEERMKAVIDGFAHKNEHYPSLLPTEMSKAAMEYNAVRVKLNDVAEPTTELGVLKDVVLKHRQPGNRSDESLVQTIEDLQSAMAELARICKMKK